MGNRPMDGNIVIGPLDFVLMSTSFNRDMWFVPDVSKIRMPAANRK